MSLATWKKEFYPISAGKVSQEEALNHSITKWEGLLEENTIRHKVTVMLGTVFGHRGKRMIQIDSSTCSLCYYYLLDEVANNPCIKCPGAIANGRACSFGVRSPYTAFYETGNAKPMLRWLMKAKKKEAKP